MTALRWLGSSPRARGTLPIERRQLPGDRFIPAGAGNAREIPGRIGPTPVHPRGRGERRALLRRLSQPSGSSPRARGTRFLIGCCIIFGRFIPAGAGNAETSPTTGTRSAVHPRGRGERSATSWPTRFSFGSSPRARGTRHPLHGVVHCLRFIPAGAGNASSLSSSQGKGAVHPRGRGERFSEPFCAENLCGSSPRARGTRVFRSEQPLDDRFIPAGAGNASTRRR